VFSTVFGKPSDMLDPSAPELELVAREGERRGAVAVAAVERQLGQDVGAQAEQALLRGLALARGDLAEGALELGAEEDRDDRGGASLAPRRWSWPTLATEARRSAWCLLTALMTAEQKNRNIAFVCGVSPGSRRLIPVSVPMDQLLCLPDPLTPAKGFSCRRQTSP
jgi:hypothetical protein